MKNQTIERIDEYKEGGAHRGGGTRSRRLSGVCALVRAALHRTV